MHKKIQKNREKFEYSVHLTYFVICDKMIVSKNEHMFVREVNMNEIWKDIGGYEGLYQVSNLGRVKRIYANRERIVNGTIYFGYRYVVLSKDGVKVSKRVHRLVAEAFLPNPNNYEVVHHRDQNRQNNCVDNLEWCTIAHNNAHRSNCLIYKG